MPARRAAAAAGPLTPTTPGGDPAGEVSDDELLVELDAREAGSLCLPRYFGGGGGTDASGNVSSHAHLWPPTRRGCFRLIGLSVLVTLLYVLFVRNSAGPSPPVKRTPTPVDGQFVRRIVAVGDLHGDMKNAQKVLRMADVVNDDYRWSGKVDYFVQTGDIIDKGEDTIEIYRWMETLRQEAHNAGGLMFSHLGNHEFMNLLGDWREVPETEIQTFGSITDRQVALSTGWIGKAWVEYYKVASRVPLHPASGAPNADYTTKSSSAGHALSHASLSFVHGGLSPGFVHGGFFKTSNALPYPSKINELGADLLNRCQTRKQSLPFPLGRYYGLPSSATKAEKELYDNTYGPLWYRGWAMDDDKTVCSKVDAVMRKIGVRRLIMGHTVNREGIVSRCGGKIIIIDTGISKWYGGVLSALSITYTLTPVLSSSNVSLPPPFSPEGAQQTFRGPSAPASSLPLSDTEHANTSLVKRKGTWIEREEVFAIYPSSVDLTTAPRKVQLAVDQRQVEGDFW